MKKHFLDHVTYKVCFYFPLHVSIRLGAGKLSNVLVPISINIWHGLEPNLDQYFEVHVLFIITLKMLVFFVGVGVDHLGLLDLTSVP